MTFIDGQALSCEEFGFFDGQGIWQPKRFTGDYSTGLVYSNDVTGTAISSTVSKLFDGSTSTTVVELQAQLLHSRLLLPFLIQAL